MVSRIIQVRSFDLVVFGATGDLAHRKIFPALYNRLVAGQMPEDAMVVGVGRKKMSPNSFRKLIKESLKKYLNSSLLQEGMVMSFLESVQYIALNVELDDNWNALRSILRHERIRTFYLSVAPELFDKIALKIFQTKLATKDSRIVVEKPLGVDQDSAKALNSSLRKYFREDQIYRIDHYLGKETVQNLMALRFSNVLFEPLWNSKFIDHVQITVAEKIGVSGRGMYYKKSGAIRDMVQNHIMQLLCLTAMEPPPRFTPDMVRDEKLKVIKSLGPVDHSQIVRGQYWKNVNDNFFIDVDDQNSQVESYVALKVSINNLRWAGTPFYLRTGKKMKKQLSEIAIVFKNLPHSIFDTKNSIEQNKLIISLQPNDGINLKTNIKDPGPGGMRITSVPLDMTFADALGSKSRDTPDAYERLIMDVIRGDQTLFMRGDEVEEAWKWIDMVVNQYCSSGKRPTKYSSYSDGPEEAEYLLVSDGRQWRNI